jgi:ketosteroid isomerase-like protein
MRLACRSIGGDFGWARLIKNIDHTVHIYRVLLGHDATTRWIDFFNKGHFAGVASLYTEDAIALPPGSAMVKGRAAIEALWKSMAQQVSDPKLTTLDVKPLGPSAAREIGTFSLKTKGPTPQEVTGKYLVVWEKIGSDWKLAVDIWNDGK